jgi:Protein of unknown function (DUF3800)
VLESYGDESGTDAQSLYASFGGYIGYEEQWRGFSGQWLDELRALRLRDLSSTLELDFHAGTFYALAKKANWSEKQKDECVTRLARIIKARKLFGFASMVSTEKYDAAFNEMIRKKRLKDRYYLLFEDAIKMQWQLLYYHGSLMGRFPAAFFFDEKKGFEARAKRLFDGLRDAKDDKHLMVSRTFVSSEDFPPIQAADFIAFELRNYGRHGAHSSQMVTTAMEELKGTLMVHEFHPAQLAKISKRLEEERRIKKGV